jgi:octaprenyl-diphosphate synthase
MDFQYTRRLEKIEALLRQALPETPDPPWLSRSFLYPDSAVPPDLVQSLTLPGWNLLNRGGKRWRPLLLTLVCEALGGGDGALPLVPLVEFPHNASLIHDDIEDNSDQRRGQPAVHLLYGIDTAINGGCFLYFLALSCLASWDAPEERKNHVYALWGECMRKLHLGQAMDIYWHNHYTALPGPETYNEMCRLKTGALPRFAAALGVYAAGNRVHGGAPVEAEERLAEELGRGAEKLGVGFQILDDVKNLSTGNPGKKRGDDIVEGKKSLPVILYLHRRKDRGEFVARCFSAARASGTGAEEVEELIAELDSSGVLQEARERGQGIIQEARDLFSHIPFTGFPEDRRGRDLLAALAAALAD